MKQTFKLVPVMAMAAGVLLLSCKKDENTNNTKKSDPQSVVITVNGVSFTMVKVEGGTFQMGDTPEQGAQGIDTTNERPVHSVTLSDFYIGETEVTQALWQAVMGDNPSFNKGTESYPSHIGDDNPVDNLCWRQCDTFVQRLSSLTGRSFRMPTEAEWEFAARGGNKSNGYRYSGSDSINEVAWYLDNSGNTTHPVKQKKPNELGLYDMSGNVREFCSDWYGHTFYSDSAALVNNPQGPAKGSYRVSRGGCWLYSANDSRVSKRGEDSESHKYFINGFRLAMVP